MARTGIPSSQIADKSIQSSDLSSSLALTGSTAISGSLEIAGPGLMLDKPGGGTGEFSIRVENDITASGFFDPKRCPPSISETSNIF